MSSLESDLRETVTAIIATELDIPPDEIRGDASIRDDLGADFLDVASLTMTIENRYRVLLQQEAAREPYTVNIIVDKLVEHSDQCRAH